MCADMAKKSQPQLVPLHYPTLHVQMKVDDLGPFYAEIPLPGFPMNPGHNYVITGLGVRVQIPVEVQKQQVKDAILKLEKEKSEQARAKIRQLEQILVVETDPKKAGSS